MLVAADDGVLVGVDHHHRPVLVHQPGYGAGLGRLQQVVAVDVQAVAGRPTLPAGAIGVGARQQQHLDLPQQRRQIALADLARQDQHCLGTGGLVAMLLADHQHQRPAQAIGAVQPQRLQGHAALRAPGL